MRTTASRQVNESANFTLPLTLMENLEATVNLTCMFLERVRQLQDPKRNSHKHKGNMQMSDRKPRANICNLLTWLWGRSANLYDTVWLRGSCLVLPKLPLSLYELHNNYTLENLHNLFLFVWKGRDMTEEFDLSVENEHILCCAQTSLTRWTRWCWYVSGEFTVLHLMLCVHLRCNHTSYRRWFDDCILWNHSISGLQGGKVRSPFCATFSS